MSTDFCPTRVPAGTLQDMAKRLSKHPQMKGVPLSKCQEILAQTFGHASFHALKTRQPACLAQDGFRDCAIRTVFYSMLHTCLARGTDLPTALEWVEALARRGGKWPLADLARTCSAQIGAGSTLAQALEVMSDAEQSTECFLLARFEEQGKLTSGLNEAQLLAEQASRERDIRWLMGARA